MARIIQFQRPGGPGVLQYKDVADPLPGPGEVRIKVKALGINRADAMWREDQYIEAVTFPARLGYEASGVIDAVGSNVTDFADGDAVSVIPSFSLNQYGMYGDTVLAPVHAVVKHPTSLSFEEAASVWMMFLTAHGALIEDAKVGAGDTVLVTAASSSVGLAAIQLANRAGAVSVALTRSSAKREILLEAGAAHVIASEEQDLVAEVMRITGGKGVRVIFDPIGGPMFSKLVDALAPLGTIYLYGALSADPTVLPLLTLIAKMPTIKAHNIWLTSGDTARREAAVEDILEGLADGSLMPVIDRVFPFEAIAETHAYLEGNSQFGKIVVTLERN